MLHHRTLKRQYVAQTMFTLSLQRKNPGGRIFNPDGLHTLSLGQVFSRWAGNVVLSHLTNYCVVECFDHKLVAPTHISVITLRVYLGISEPPCTTICLPITEFLHPVLQFQVYQCCPQHFLHMADSEASRPGRQGKCHTLAHGSLVQMSCCLRQT